MHFFSDKYHSENMLSNHSYLGMVPFIHSLYVFFKVAVTSTRILPDTQSKLSNPAECTHMRKRNVPTRMHIIQTVIIDHVPFFIFVFLRKLVRNGQRICMN